MKYTHDLLANVIQYLNAGVYGVIIIKNKHFKTHLWKWGIVQGHGYL